MCLSLGCIKLHDFVVSCGRCTTITTIYIATNANFSNTATVMAFSFLTLLLSSANSLNHLLPNYSCYLRPISIIVVFPSMIVSFYRFAASNHFVASWPSSSSPMSSDSLVIIIMVEDPPTQVHYSWNRRLDVVCMMNHQNLIKRTDSTDSLSI